MAFQARVRAAAENVATLIHKSRILRSSSDYNLRKRRTPRSDSESQFNQGRHIARDIEKRSLSPSNYSFHATLREKNTPPRSWRKNTRYEPAFQGFTPL